MSARDAHPGTVAEGSDDEDLYESDADLSAWTQRIAVVGTAPGRHGPQTCVTRASR